MAGTADDWNDLDMDSKAVLLKKVTTDAEIQKIADDWNTTPSMVKEVKHDLENSPQLFGKGAVLGKHGGSHPSNFTKRARGISYVSAFCELIDGVLENHKNRNDKNKVTTITFALKGGGSYLELTEDSGGIAKDKFDSVAEIGNTGWGNLWGVGVFGIGLKKAMRKIATRHHLFTWYDGGGDPNNADPSPAEMNFTTEFWKNAGIDKVESKITPDPVMKKKKGYTIIKFLDLETYFNEKLEFTQEFVDEIGRYYYQWLKEIPGTVNIIFSEGLGNEIHLPKIDLFSDDKIRKNFSYYPGYEPRSFILKTKGQPDVNNKISDLTIRVKFGLTRDVSAGTNKAGVYVYGNDRMFQGNAQGVEFGFGTMTPFGAVKPFHAETYKFRAKVDIKAENPEDIPWNIEHKNGYDATHPTAVHIVRMISAAAYYYMWFADKTKNAHTVPFTVNGIDRTTDQWEECFFPENKDDLSSSSVKAAIIKLDSWGARDILDTVIDFSKLAAKEDKEDIWDPKEMNLIRDQLVKKRGLIKSPGSYSDFEWVDDLVNVYGVKKPVKPAATKPAATKPAATKPAATKPAATKPAATKPAVMNSVMKGKLGEVKKKKAKGKSVKFQAMIPDSVRDSFYQETPFDNSDEPTAVRHLLAHFMMTKKYYDPKDMPKGKGQKGNTALKTWFDNEKWEKKSVKKKSKKKGVKKKSQL